MGEPFFDPEHYRSDSNQPWRHGCPHEQLAAGEFEWLQLLTHPEIWAFDGATMRETMGRSSTPTAPRGSSTSATTGSTLVSEADHRHRHRLRRAGHGGAAARAARERRARGPARRHGHERALGRASSLRRVPHRPGRRRPGLSRRDAARSPSGGRGRDPAAVVVRPRRARGARSSGSRSPCSSRRRTRSGARTTRPRRTRCCTGSASRHRDFRRVHGAREVEAAAHELGYPERPVCFKPVFSSGSRGFRILDPTVDRADQLLRERPGSVSMLLEEAVEILASVDDGHRPARDGARDRRRADDRRDRERPRDRARAPEDARGDARRARDVLRHARRPGADGARQHDRRRARDRALLQHPARRRAT